MFRYPKNQQECAHISMFSMSKFKTHDDRERAMATFSHEKKAAGVYSFLFVDELSPTDDLLYRYFDCVVFVSPALRQWIYYKNRLTIERKSKPLF